MSTLSFLSLYGPWVPRESLSQSGITSISPSVFCLSGSLPLPFTFCLPAPPYASSPPPHATPSPDGCRDRQPYPTSPDVSPDVAAQGRIASEPRRGRRKQDSTSPKGARRSRGTAGVSRRGVGSPGIDTSPLARALPWLGLSPGAPALPSRRSAAVAVPGLGSEMSTSDALTDRVREPDPRERSRTLVALRAPAGPYPEGGVLCGKTGPGGSADPS